MLVRRGPCGGFVGLGEEARLVEAESLGILDDDVPEATEVELSKRWILSGSG